MARIVDSVQNVLVTGCSSGLGWALCEALHEIKSHDGVRAYRVFPTARNVDRLEELKSRGMEPQQLDVTSAESVDACVKALGEKSDAIDVLIANAGILRVMPLIEQPIDDMEQMLDTNVIGVMRIVQAVVPGMIQQGSGTIVIVGSVSGYITTPFGGMYAGSKACVHALADCLRMELSPFNINVLYVEAGAFKSSLASNGTESINLGEASLYKSLKTSMEKRLQIGQTSSDCSATMVAQEIVRAMRQEKIPFKVKAGGKAGFYKFLGLLSTYLLPHVMFNRLCQTFGLVDLKEVLAGKSS